MAASNATGAGKEEELEERPSELEGLLKTLMGQLRDGEWVAEQQRQAEAERRPKIWEVALDEGEEADGAGTGGAAPAAGGAAPGAGAGAAAGGAAPGAGAGGAGAGSAAAGGVGAGSTPAAGTSAGSCGK
jgi:hypothetical protein